jgi:hypothetical protein
MKTAILHGIHMSDPVTADRMMSLAEAERLHVWRIDLKGVTSKSALLDTVAKGIGFPDYFGGNWDSFEECLRDFDEGKGWLVILDHADSLLSIPESELSTFKVILSDVAAFWEAENRTFGVAFVGTDTLAAKLELSRVA